MDEPRLRACIEANGLDDWADQIVGVAAPCILLRAARDKSNPPATGSSKLGGEPDLSPGTSWPLREGRPMSFLGQVRLDELPAIDPESPLPRTGLLSFFYDCENQPWGFDPKDKSGHRILYCRDATRLQRQVTPEEVEDEGWFLECKLVPELGASLPGNPPEFLPEDESDAYYELVVDNASREVSGHHQLMGLPAEIQNPMELECQLASHGLYCGGPSGYNDPRSKELEAGAADWRLLLQIDSEDQADMMWGDCGMLYFLMRKQDLADADFSRSWLVLQCH